MFSVFAHYCLKSQVNSIKISFNVNSKRSQDMISLDTYGTTNDKQYQLGSKLDINYHDRENNLCFSCGKIIII